jgi:CheY-like chemotaxis protein
MMTNVRPRILLLEDRDDWTHLVSLLLRDDYDVIPARTLEDARQLVATSAFHLAIVDISLIPEDEFDEQGLQLIADLRATEILRDMSIIVLSAYPEVEGAETPERWRVAFRDYNVVDFFNKNRFDKEEFKRTVAEAVAESYLGSMRDNV